MTKLKVIAFIVLVVATGYGYFSFKGVSFGSAPSGLQASIASTTNITVSSTVGAVAIATSTCSSRVISTGASAIMVTFSDYAGQTPTGSFGFPQSASTTVAYDSGLFGCGAVKIYSFTSQLITVSDVR